MRSDASAHHCERSQPQCRQRLRSEASGRGHLHRRRRNRSEASITQVLPYIIGAAAATEDMAGNANTAGTAQFTAGAAVAVMDVRVTATTIDVAGAAVSQRPQHGTSGPLPPLTLEEPL